MLKGPPEARLFQCLSSPGPGPGAEHEDLVHKQGPHMPSSSLWPGLGLWIGQRVAVRYREILQPRSSAPWPRRERVSGAGLTDTALLGEVGSAAPPRGLRKESFHIRAFTEVFHVTWCMFN